MTENVDLSTAIGVDHDRDGVAQVATAVDGENGAGVELIRSLVGQREGRVSETWRPPSRLGTTTVGRSICARRPER